MGAPGTEMDGATLKARRFRFIDTNGQPFTQKSFADMLGLAPNTISIIERGGRAGDEPGVARGRNLHLLDVALNWFELEAGLVPWPRLSRNEQRRALELAQSVLRADELVTPLQPAPARKSVASTSRSKKGRSSSKRAAVGGSGR